MEDLWRFENSGVDVDDFADIAEYKRFLKRFSSEEENNNRNRLLYGETSEKPSKE
jgi:hypothetical protein